MTADRQRLNLELPKKVHEKLERTAQLRRISMSDVFCVASAEWILVHGGSDDLEQEGRLLAVPSPRLKTLISHPHGGTGKRLVEQLTEAAFSQIVRIRQQWIDGHPTATHFAPLFPVIFRAMASRLPPPELAMPDGKPELGQTKQFTPTLPTSLFLIDVIMGEEADARGQSKQGLYREALVWWLIQNYSTLDKKVDGWKVAPSRVLIEYARQILGVDEQCARDIISVRSAFADENKNPFACLTYMLSKLSASA